MHSLHISLPFCRTPFKQFCECQALFWGPCVCVPPRKLESPLFKHLIFFFSPDFYNSFFFFFCSTIPRLCCLAFTFVNCFSSGVNWQNVWGAALMCDLSLSWACCWCFGVSHLGILFTCLNYPFDFAHMKAPLRSFAFALLLVQFQSKVRPAREPMREEAYCFTGQLLLKRCKPKLTGLNFSFPVRHVGPPPPQRQAIKST